MPEQQPEPKYYTVREVAEILSLSPDAVREMCRVGPKYGGLRAMKGPSRNSRYRIPASAITEWEQRNEYNPGF